MTFSCKCVSLEWKAAYVTLKSILGRQRPAGKVPSKVGDWHSIHILSRYKGALAFFYSYFILIGGKSAAKFAGNQLVNLLSVLNNLNEPTALKMVRRPYF